MADTKLKEQLDAIAEETKQGLDELTSKIFDEYDWLSNDNEKIVNALRDIQNKLQEKKDIFTELINAEDQDWDMREEVQGKVDLLSSKIKELSVLLRNQLTKNGK